MATILKLGGRLYPPQYAIWGLTELNGQKSRSHGQRRIVDCLFISLRLEDSTKFKLCALISWRVTHDAISRPYLFVIQYQLYKAYLSLYNIIACKFIFIWRIIFTMCVQNWRRWRCSCCPLVLIMSGIIAKTATYIYIRFNLKIYTWSKERLCFSYF